jgi:hypothetical protein
MNLTNNFNSQTILVGKSIVKNGDDGEVKYFTVIKPNDAPYLISDQIAKELFAPKGGKVSCIYVAKVISQFNGTPVGFIYEKQVISVDSFAQDLKLSEDDVKLYIIQFMAYDKFHTEAIQASSLLQVKRHLFLMCPTYRIINIIITKINYTERV